MLETIPFLLNSDDFVFDTEVIAQAAAYGFRIAEIGVPTRYFKEASSVNFQRSVVYGIGTLAVMLRFSLAKWNLVRFPQFKRTLPEVISRYHVPNILRGAGPEDSEQAAVGELTEGGERL